jgi:predicted DNA-binding transcriptional regulator AlpA
MSANPLREENPERLLNPHEVADMLGMSASWVRDHAASPAGKKAKRHPVLPVVRIGSSHRAELRFRRQDIEEFIARNLRTEPERTM